MGGAAFLLVVEFAADATIVKQGEEAMAARHGAIAAPLDLVDRVAALEGAATDVARASCLRLRVSARASRLGAAYAALSRVGAQVVVHPGLGLLCARVPLLPEDGTARIDAALDAARAAARIGEGHAILAAAPLHVRAGRNLFLEGSPAPDLQRRLRDGFDPAGVLNPGRMEPPR